MKKSKIYLALIFSVLLMAMTACVTIADPHSHSYSDWIIDVEPTETTVGKAHRTCECGESVTTDVPAFSDETVWIKYVDVDPTCTEEGTVIYASDFGVFEVTAKPLPHTFAEYEVVVAPTLTEEGTAKGKCSVCGTEITVDLPVLTDESFWKVVDEKASTCSEAGYKTFSSAYVEVTIDLELAAHTYEWTITVAPTLTEEGTALGVCSECGDEQEVVLPALTDEEVWTKVSETEATYNEGGKVVYESLYGIVEIDTAKKVAPYDGKTYTTFEYDSTDYSSKTLSPERITLNNVTLDTFGKGEGSSYPLNGEIAIKMVNEETGEIEISVDGTTSVGYVDFASGIIITPYYSTFDDIFVWVPFEVATSSDIRTNSQGSSWDNSMAITYAVDGVEYSLFVNNGKVYGGVEFVDAEGASVAAADCYENDYVYVKDQEGNQLFGFAYNGTELVATDGYEGTYTIEDITVVVSGYGVVTVSEAEGTYEVLDAGAKVLAVYVNDEYLEVTLDTENMTCTMSKPMITITFDTDDKATVEALTINKNIAVKLPVPTNETWVFRGWYLDSKFTEVVPETFAAETSVTLYALWAQKVTLNLNGVLEGDESVLILGEGDIIGDYLPAYGVEVELNKVFKGWFLDENYETSLPEAATVTTADDNTTVYAKWEDLPAYYGEYLGTEIWGETSGNSSTYTLTIDENGKISGKLTGTVQSYDPETQLITWVDSSNKVRYFWYNAEAEVVVVPYSERTPIEIGTDFYIAGKHQTTNNVATNYGINVPKTPGSSSTGYYARFVNVMTVDGPKDLFVYNNYIYSAFEATDTSGNPLTAATVKNSKTLVVKDAEGNTIVAVASLGASFDDETDTVVLDTYYGTYTNETETIVLDGVGGVVYGEKTGTYAVASEDAGYDFDIYLENNTEYYQLTIEGTNFTIVKPTVTVTFVVGDHTPVPQMEANINVVVSLPEVVEDGFVFNGWFTDDKFVNPVAEELILTEDITLYGKYSLPAILTIVYNNGVSDEVIVYSQGDVVSLARPDYEGHTFIGWYTLPNYEAWNNGSVITEDLTIYANWQLAPIYSNNYLVTEVNNDSDNSEFGGVSDVYTRTGAFADIDPYGLAPKGNSWPINNAVKISNYKSETSTLEFYIGETVYKGFIDPNSEIMIVNSAAGLDAELVEVWFLNPYEQTSISDKLLSSYWDGGKTRTMEYTYEGTTYTFFVYNNNVYFDVAFKDAEGNTVSADDCFGSENLYVTDEKGKLIAKFGFDGEKMVALDGLEGTYTNETEGAITLNGVKVLTKGELKGTYAIVEGAEYTLDVYLDGQYFEVTLDMETKTYTMNKPMVTITFDAGDKATVDEVEVNKNIAIQLATPTNADYIFRGWYLDDEFVNVVDLEAYVPTKDCTLYAKWDIKVTLIVVYGNGLNDEVLEYGAGDLVAPVEPAFTNGQIFDGWFLDDTFETPYTVSTIEEDTTIYCKWMDANALYGEYAGFEIWGSSTNGSTSSGATSAKTFTVDPTGNAKGSDSGVVTDYNPETGFFKLVDGTSYNYGYFDAENGVIVLNYYSGDELGDDYYVFFRDYQTAKSGSLYSSYWLAGYARLMEVALTTKTGEAETILMFVYNDEVHVNVTYSSPTNPDEFGPEEAYKQNSINIYAENGELLYEFTKKGAGLELKALDGYQGTYTVGSDTLVLDGYGAGTLNGVAMTYTFADTLFTVVCADVVTYYEYDAETSTFTVKEMDVLAGKVATITYACPEEYGYDTHTITYTFDGISKVVIEFECENYYSYCYPTMSGEATYTLEGNVLTITKGSTTVVFELDNVENPTTLTCTSTTLSEYVDSDYFDVNTVATVA